MQKTTKKPTNQQHTKNMKTISQFKTPTKNSYSLSYYQRRKALNNILQMYYRATPETIQEGMQWYEQANRYTREVSIKTGYPINTVAQVISALSPSVQWDVNKAQAHAMISAHKKNEPLESVTVSTYDNNKEKAWDILGGYTQIGAKSLKTYAFYKNIMLNNEHVTIDRHILRTLFSRAPKSLTAKRYREIAEIFHTVADVLYIEPYQLQAIVWVQAIKEATK